MVKYVIKYNFKYVRSLFTSVKLTNYKCNLPCVIQNILDYYKFTGSESERQK